MSISLLKTKLNFAILGLGRVSSGALPNTTVAKRTLVTCSSLLNGTIRAPTIGKTSLTCPTKFGATVLVVKRYNAKQLQTNFFTKTTTFTSTEKSNNNSSSRSSSSNTTKETTKKSTTTKVPTKTYNVYRWSATEKEALNEATRAKGFKDPTEFCKYPNRLAFVSDWVKTRSLEQCRNYIEYHFNGRKCRRYNLYHFGGRKAARQMKC